MWGDTLQIRKNSTNSTELIRKPGAPSPPGLNSVLALGVYVTLDELCHLPVPVGIHGTRFYPTSFVDSIENQRKSARVKTRKKLEVHLKRGSSSSWRDAGTKRGPLCPAGTGGPRPDDLRCHARAELSSQGWHQPKVCNVRPGVRETAWVCGPLKGLHLAHCSAYRVVQIIYIQTGDVLVI